MTKDRKHQESMSFAENLPVSGLAPSSTEFRFETVPDRSGIEIIETAGTASPLRFAFSEGVGTT